MLIEKAYAKLYGCFEVLNSGSGAVIELHLAIQPQPEVRVLDSATFQIRPFPRPTSPFPRGSDLEI